MVGKGIWFFKIDKATNIFVDDVGNPIDGYYAFPFGLDFDFDADISEDAINAYHNKHLRTVKTFVASMFEISDKDITSVTEDEYLGAYNEEETTYSVGDAGLFTCPDCGANIGLNNLNSFKEPEINKRSDAQGDRACWIHFD